MLIKPKPENCLHMAALEMSECPEVAIIQHTSGVLKVALNVFETGSEYFLVVVCTYTWLTNPVSFLTHLVYTTVQYNVASGDCAVVS